MLLQHCSNKEASKRASNCYQKSKSREGNTRTMCSQIVEQKKQTFKIKVNHEKLLHPNLAIHLMKVNFQEVHHQQQLYQGSEE